MRKHQINSDGEAFYKITGLYSSKMLVSPKEKTEELFPIKIDERGLFNALRGDPGPSPLPKGGKCQIGVWTVG